MGMFLFKKIPFVFEEKDYEIKVFYNADTVNIVAFRKHYPANGFRHRIKMQKGYHREKMGQNNTITFQIIVYSTCILLTPYKKWV